jgi:hypothetical protein
MTIHAVRGFRDENPVLFFPKVKNIYNGEKTGKTLAI